MSQGHCSLWSHFHKCSPTVLWSTWLHDTHPLDSLLIPGCPGPHHCNCHQWSQSPDWQSALSWTRGSPCFILSPGPDPSGFLGFLFSHAYPPVRPPSLCLCLEQMSGAPSASSACHLFGVVCPPPTAFALHVGKVFVSFIFIFCRCQELGTAQIAQDKSFVCFVHSFAQEALDRHYLRNSALHTGIARDRRGSIGGCHFIQCLLELMTPLHIAQMGLLATLFIHASQAKRGRGFRKETEQ